MKSLRKHPFLTTVILVSFLVFMLSFIFLILLRRDYTASDAKLEKIRIAYHALAEAYPSPTKENLNLSEKNTKNLRDILVKKRNSLIAENNILPNDNDITGIEVLAKIQGFLLDFENATLYSEPLEMESKIVLPEKEAFGFAKFSGSNTAAPSDKNAPKLDLQLGILRYILTELYAARPISIQAIEREAVIELNDQKKDFSAMRTRSSRKKSIRTVKKSLNPEDIFQVDPAITAQVPGSIHTMGFKLVFSGYTDCLREFLVRIADFEIPLVIRDISVKPQSIKEDNDVNTRSKRFKSSFSSNPFDSLINGSDKSSNKSIDKNFNSNKGQEPIVSNNESIFTVILEYIQIITEMPESVKTIKI